MTEAVEKTDEISENDQNLDRHAIVENRNEEWSTTTKTNFPMEDDSVLEFNEHHMKDQTKVTDYFDILDDRFALILNLKTEWDQMAQGEQRSFALWNTVADELLLVVTRLSVTRSVSEGIPSVSVNLAQASRVVTVTQLENIKRTTKDKGGVIQLQQDSTVSHLPWLILRTLRDLDNWVKNNEKP